MGAEAADGRTHRFTICHRGENDLRAAQFRQLRRRILRLAVNVMPRAELPGQRFLVFPAGNGHRLETHFHRELYAEVTESADPKDRHQVAGPRTAVAEGVECRE